MAAGCCDLQSSITWSSLEVAGVVWVNRCGVSFALTGMQTARGDDRPGLGTSTSVLPGVKGLASSRAATARCAAGDGSGTVGLDV